MATPIRVLILEDNLADAELLVDELRQAELDPIWERVADERGYLEHLTPALDVILADFTLPQFDALRALHALQERGWDIPFIIVTATISEDLAVECMRQGAADYFLKDRLSRLGQAVRGVLAAKRVREEKQAAEIALRIHDALVSFATHDLRTPLTVIKGQAQWLDRLSTNGRLTPAVLMAGLTRIDAACRATEALIGELVDGIRLQAAQQLDLQLQPTKLVELTSRCVAEQQQTTQRHTLRLVAGHPEIVGEWDPVRLERVLFNLLTNAIKYSPNGGTITVTVDRRHGEPSWAELSIQDEGVGIPQADLPHVFERFFRAANVTGRFRGSGIGLAGVRQIVEQHQGTISATSVEGRGSTFTVRLPLTRQSTEIHEPAGLTEGPVERRL